MKKVCFFGAESTGKTSMAEKIARHYSTVFVPEVAREMIQSNNFSLDDIIEIGKEQVNRIIKLEERANKILICDTDLITTQIYSQLYLGRVPPILFELENQISFDHYFLFDIDVPWVADGLRDLKDQRDVMHNKFMDSLNQRNLPYTLVFGSWDQRFEIISGKIQSLLGD
ncbi:MAG: ATP-binding protein [Cyclobacteriaceae bacterium]|nr:ATP-binding protein [Cyclobacteriaceae bacterium]